MIEKVLRDYLADMMEVPVYLTEPEPGKKPIRYVLLEKTGSGEEDGIKTSTFAVQSYARDRLSDAAELNEAVKQVLRTAVLLDAITSVRLNSDYNFTDTETKRPRYQAVFDITHY